MDTWDYQCKLKDDIDLETKKIAQIEKISRALDDETRKQYRIEYLNLIGLSHRLDDGIFNAPEFNSELEMVSAYQKKLQSMEELYALKSDEEVKRVKAASSRLGLLLGLLVGFFLGVELSVFF